MTHVYMAFHAALYEGVRGPFTAGELFSQIPQSTDADPAWQLTPERCADALQKLAEHGYIEVEYLS